MLSRRPLPLPSRITIAVLGAAAALALAGALLARVYGAAERRIVREERALASAAAELAEARTLLFAVESDLRELRYAPADSAASTREQAARRVPVAVRGAREALGRWIRVSPLAAGAEGGRGAETYREATAALDSIAALAERMAEGDRPPIGTIGFATGAVAQPLLRLADLERLHAELVRAERAEELARHRLRAWTAMALASILAALLSAWARTSAVREEEEARGRARAALDRAEGRMRAAEELSERKTHFINHVSHEFRTPLSSIIGFTSLLAAEHARLAPAVRAEYLEIILRNARHLLHVVNDLLNLSKVEAGTLEVTAAPVYVPEVVAWVTASLRPMARDAGIALEVVDEGRHFAIADSGRLRQVLFNLVENAVKYSAPGTRVEVRIGSGDEEVRVEVRDQGPGIAPEDLGKLFREFSRIPRPGSRVAGAGLGLALSQRMAEAMRGRIGVESAPGVGSTFWVTLPAGEALVGERRAGALARAEAAPGDGARVAVVDDDADIRSYAATILARGGYVPVTDDGSEGLGARLAEQAPALVLLDLSLDGRSGSAALAEIRARPELDDVPVLAFSASVAEADHLRVAADGFRGLLAKPVEPEALLARVGSLLHAASAAAAEPEAGLSAPAGDEEDEEEFLAPLRARFLAGLPERLRALRERAAAGDAGGVAREAHKLKGAAAGYRMPGLSRTAAAAEEAVRAGGPVDGPAVARLAEALQAAIASGTAA